MAVAGIFSPLPDATPLEEDEIQGLIPGYLSTRDDLNQAEAENIAKAQILFIQKPRFFLNTESLLTTETVLRVHEEMFGDVWKWAGQYRTRETNIGIDPRQIRFRLPELLLNVEEQLKHCDLVHQAACDEIAIRFHWDLVRIHPFPNGNGRHARMMADLLVASLGYPRFSWGAYDLVESNSLRKEYIAALREADATLGNVERLLRFARGV